MKKTEYIRNLVMAISVSEKGLDFKGDKLTDDTLHSGMLVTFRKTLYWTGNRYHSLVELYDLHNPNVLKRVQRIHSVHLVENKLLP